MESMASSTQVVFFTTHSFFFLSKENGTVVERTKLPQALSQEREREREREREAFNNSPLIRERVGNRKVSPRMQLPDNATLSSILAFFSFLCSEMS